MEYVQFLVAIYSRLYNELAQALQDLTAADLNYQPGAGLNNIGWLAWHTIRSQDRMNADLFGEEQLWIREKWYARFNRQPDPRESGYGHTAQQAAEFRAPDVLIYLEYYRAVAARTQQYLTTRLTPADLERQVISPTLGTTNTVAERLSGTINNFQHVGQAGYVKGMLKGFGWYGR
jgi:hypothetical protein